MISVKKRGSKSCNAIVEVFSCMRSIFYVMLIWCLSTWQASAVSSSRSHHQKHPPEQQRLLDQREYSPNSMEFDAPFFIAWYCSLWNTLFLPIFSLLKMFPCCFQREKSSPRNILVWVHLRNSWNYTNLSKHPESQHDIFHLQVLMKHHLFELFLKNMFWIWCMRFEKIFMQRILWCIWK